MTLPRHPAFLKMCRPMAAVRWLMPVMALLLSAPHVPPAVAQPAENLVHTWTQLYYGKLDGKEQLLFSGGIERAKPAIGDLDGDGDVDLLVGTAQGLLMLFENRGSTKSPLWRLAAQALRADFSAAGRGSEAAWRPIAVDGNAAPALVDIDGDDDLDLLVGSANGGLHYFRNVGNRYLPHFQLANPNFLGSHIGRNLVIGVADVNGDGLADLAAGNAEGGYYLLINQGTRQAPRFCLELQPVAPDCLVPRHKFGQLDPEDNAAPSWVDWDGDGDLDLMVGKSDGKLAYYRNIGDMEQGIWELAQPRFLILDSGGYAAPVFHDFNGDGRPDLLLAGDSDQIAYYINRPEGDGAELWLDERSALQLAKLGRFQSRLHFASGDLDGDGRPELVVGTRGGQLLIYQNVGSKDQIALRSPSQPLLPTPSRVHSVPALADIDGDGDLDLVVGGGNGRLEFIQNTGTARKPSWKMVDLFYGQIDVGSMSAPAFHDLDKDGDLDLLIGNSLGQVVVYQNRGTRTRPEFNLLTVGFAGVKMAGSAAPAVFPYDPKKDPLIVVGGRNGGLLPIVRNPVRVVAQTATPVVEYQAGKVPWLGLRSRAYSAPHFVDLTGDGRRDLLLGGENGTLAFWRYEGAVPAEQLAKKRQEPGRNIVPEGGQVSLAAQLAASEPPASAQPRSLAPVAQERFTPLDPIFTRGDSGIARIVAGRSTKPAFIDADGDGDLDLLVGNRKGKLILFRNPGDQPRQGWRKITEAFAGYSHGHNAAPAAVDLDGDGDLDLAVGTESGQILFWENGGRAQRPLWIHRPDVFSNIRAGKNAVPSFFDLNGDKRLDLLVGSLRGRLLFYQNLGGFPPNFKLVQRDFLSLDVGVNASPNLVSLVGAGRPVLLVGSDRGRIEVFVSTGAGRDSAGAAGWALNKFFLEGLNMPPGSHPALADLDKDGDLDLYVGSDRGEIQFFQNNALVRGTANLSASQP